MLRNGLRSRTPLSQLSPNSTVEQTVSRRIRSRDNRDRAPDTCRSSNVEGGDNNDIFWKLPADSYPDKLRTLDNGDIAKFESQKKRGVRGSTGSLTQSKSVAWRYKKPDDVKQHPPPPPPFPRMDSTVGPIREVPNDIQEEITLAPRASTTLGFSVNQTREEIPRDYMLSGTIWRKQGKMFRRWRKCHAYMNALHLVVAPRNFSGIIQIKNQEQIILHKSTCIKVGRRAQIVLGDGPNWIFHLYTEDGRMYVLGVAKEHFRDMWMNNLNAAARTLKHVGE